MGTDIHSIPEVKIDGAWRRVTDRIPEELQSQLWRRAADRRIYDENQSDRSRLLEYAATRWYDDRDYDAFAILADVRNEADFTPIAEPRGLPPDFVRGADDDLGDHSLSWVTLAELEAYDWDATVIKSGVTSWECFAERFAANDKGAPKAYCGGIWGPGIVVLTEDSATSTIRRNAFGETGLDPKNTHVLVRWVEKCIDAAPSITDPGRLLDRLRWIRRTYCVSDHDVRLVFGFDS